MDSKDFPLSISRESVGDVTESAVNEEQNMSPNEQIPTRNSVISHSDQASTTPIAGTGESRCVQITDESSTPNVDNHKTHENSEECQFDQMASDNNAKSMGQTSNEQRVSNDFVKAGSNERTQHSFTSDHIDQLSRIPVPAREAAETINGQMTDGDCEPSRTGSNDVSTCSKSCDSKDGETEDKGGMAGTPVTSLTPSEDLSDRPLSIEITPGGVSDNSVLSPSGISVTSSQSTSGTPPPSPKLPTPVEAAITRQPTERDGKVKSKRRGTAWNDDQTDFLMEIWARHVDNSKGDEMSHNAPVYRLIASAMAEHGIDKTWEQCKTRIHTLKRAYKLTRDEVYAGSPAITYCRHFESLKSIMGEHPTMTSKMLADALMARRQQKEANRATIQQETPKRKLPTVTKSAKKANTGSQSATASGLSVASANVPSPANAAVITNNISQCYPPQPVQMQPPPLPTPPLQQLLAPSQPQLQQQQPVSTSLPNFPFVTQPNVFTQQFPPPPPYPAQRASAQSKKTPKVTSRPAEINNNDVTVKQEKPDSSTDFQTPQQIQPPLQTWNTYTTIQSSQQQQPQQQTTDDLERMRIDLEMKKIEVERNKIEMEERQRREERDHQYRMMQLLLFGLGQQTSTHACTGQSSEDVAPTSKTLTRAIENGLVPGGTYTVNEKGLSFSEI